MSQKEGSPEFIVEPELDINPARIWEDNHSLRANELRQEFGENLSLNLIIFEGECIDSRIRRKMVARTMHYSTIAAAGEVKKITKAMQSPKVLFVVFKPHHGLEIIGKSPTECGGRSAKAKLLRKDGENNPEGNLLLEYVKDDIPHHDVVIAGCRIAGRAAFLINKPVVVIAQNHRTGEEKVIALYEKIMGKRKEYLHIQSSIVDQKLINSGEYNPGELYKNGIPYLDIEDLENDQIKAYLESCKKELDIAKADDPDYEKKHILHNPDLMILTTDLSSPEILLPEISSHPGSIVRLSVPRTQGLDKTNVIFELSDLQKAWGQAQYVISEAAENHDDISKPFSKTRNILILTSSFDQAKDLATDLMDRSFMIPWLNLPHRNIMIGETNSGVITKLGKIEYKMDEGVLTKINVIFHFPQAN